MCLFKSAWVICLRFIIAARGHHKRDDLGNELETVYKNMENKEEYHAFEQKIIHEFIVFLSLKGKGDYRKDA